MNDLVCKQKKFFEIISKIVEFGKLSHSYIIEVSNYEDDLKYINIFMKMILCDKQNINYNNLDCSECNICKLIDANNYPDIKIVEADGQFIKKNQLIDIKSDFKNKSLLNNKKIYIIKGAENLNLSSANTILKFLEEPEDDIIAILLTRNRYKIMDTIVSRCQILSLNNADDRVDISLEVSYLLNSIVNKDLFIDYKYIYDSILSDKESAKKYFSDIEMILIDYLKNENKFLNVNELDILKKLNKNKIDKYIVIMEEEMSKLVYNINYKIWLDCIFARFMEV